MPVAFMTADLTTGCDAHGLGPPVVRRGRLAEVTDTKLISDLLALSPKRRAKIAGILLRSLDDEEEVDEQEVEDAWATEIARRVEEIRSGKAKMVSGEAFMRKLRAKVKRARRPAK